jgi:transmembrane sensor
MIAWSMRNLRRSISVLFSTILLMTAFTQLTLTLKLADSGRIYTTATGEQRTISLAGGSRIVMDAESALKIVAAGNVTQVFMLQGRAYYDLTQNPSRQTAVYTPGTKLLDVGTKFTVELLDEAKTLVVLQEGMVEAEVRSSSVLDGSTPGPPAVERTTLLDHQILLVQPLDSRAHVRTESLTQAQLDRRLYWKDGVLDFQGGDSLEAVVRELNRYCKIKIRVDPSARDVKVGGRYRINDFDHFAEMVADQYKLQISQQGPNEVNLSRKR